MKISEGSSSTTSRELRQVGSSVMDHITSSCEVFLCRNLGLLTLMHNICRHFFSIFQYEGIYCH